MKNIVDLYLVSDSTGETVSSIARASLAHFEDLRAEEHLWSFVRTKGQIDKLSISLQKKRGIVMFTIVNEELQNYLLEICSKLEILAIPVLSEAVSTLSSYLAIKTINQPGRQHKMNDE
jgi:[pyruvate, water dikinase]-phosphate phosphotransferase / [pyruvate, water dikinase] kinase